MRASTLKTGKLLFAKEIIMQTIFLSFAILFILIVLSTALLSVAYRFCKKAFLNILGIGEEINLASAILMGALLLSMGLYANYCMGPLRNFMALTKTAEALEMVKFSGYLLLLVLICFGLSFLVTFLCFKIVDRFSPEINEAHEIRDNNIPLALIVSVIILATVVISREAFVMALESMIPYPQLPYR